MLCLVSVELNRQHYLFVVCKPLSTAAVDAEIMFIGGTRIENPGESIMKDIIF